MKRFFGGKGKKEESISTGVPKPPTPDSSTGITLQNGALQNLLVNSLLLIKGVPFEELENTERVHIVSRRRKIRTGETRAEILSADMLIDVLSGDLTLDEKKKDSFAMLLSYAHPAAKQMREKGMTLEQITTAFSSILENA